MSWSFLVFAGACFVAAMSGGLFRPGAWYRALNKPSWQPPDWLFGPVWFVLYWMIAFAGWIVWERTGGQGDLAAAVWPMIAYGAQLVLNFLWSLLFFGMKRIRLALFEVLAMHLSIVACIVLFWPISRTAALLMAPYLVWVSFAAFLNYTLVRLNPDGGLDPVVARAS